MKQNLFEKLLNHFQISSLEYELITKEKSLTDIRSYQNFKDIQKAADFVKNYLILNKKVLIYGDYDADGMMSTSILMKAFSYFSKDIKYFIPSRYIDGYGLNLENAKKIIQAGYDLVVTVDNGISQNEEISLLKNSGISVVVLDHHQVQGELPCADFILHPSVSNYGEVATSAGFVSFMFSIALLGKIDKYLATLASITLVSDMMPLVSYNRDLLKCVIDNYKKGEFPAIDLLLEDSSFNEESIGVKIGPKINSTGRMIKDSSVNRIVKYFISENEQEMLSYLSWINSTNENRKEKTKIARENLLNTLDSQQRDANSYCILTDAEEGLIGLLATSIINEHKKPTIIFTKEEKNPNIIKGSARSLPGFNVVECFALAKDFALNYGGHSLAGGIAIKIEDFEKFSNIFETYAKNHPGKEDFSNSIEIGIDEINEDNYKLIKSFSPFGEGWKSPLLSLKKIKSSSLNLSRNKIHIISPIGINNRIIIFNVEQDLIKKAKYINIYGNIKKTYFNYRNYIDFVAKNIEEN